jgi:hypothetical protein
LDAQLVTSTGLTAEETTRRFGDFATAGHLAAAVAPFLPSDAPAVPELARALAGDLETDRAGTIAAVRALYAPAEAEVPAKAVDVGRAG